MKELPTMEYQQAWDSVSCLIKEKWPFQIKISGGVVDPKNRLQP